MDRSARSQADHTLLKRLLLRQFVVRSIVGLITSGYRIPDDSIRIYADPSIRIA